MKSLHDGVVNAIHGNLPIKHTIPETPIPSYPGEFLHIDIFRIDKKHYLTCIDKFSKFVIVQKIDSRTKADEKPKILQLMSNTKTIYCDKE